MPRFTTQQLKNRKKQSRTNYLGSKGPTWKFSPIDINLDTPLALDCCIKMQAIGAPHHFNVRESQQKKRKPRTVAQPFPNAKVLNLKKQKRKTPCRYSM